MKTVINVCIGGRAFTIDEDAYQKLDSYLEDFRKKTGMDFMAKEVMEDVEYRIVDLFNEALESSRQEVVDISMVNSVISKIGMPDGSSASENKASGEQPENEAKPQKKYYRDEDDKKIAGVCSGLAAYLDVDVTLVRIVFVVALLCGSAGFWVYLVFWIISPVAVTAAQKCEMRGIAANAENMKRFTYNRQ